MIKPLSVKVLPSTTYRRRRILPADGDIVVRVGDSVHHETPIARVVLPSPPVNVPVASILNVRPKDMAAHLVKQVGDRIQAGEVIARRKATLLQGKTDCASPIDGTIEFISYDTGQITIRRPARPTVIWAEATGTVTEIVPKQALTIETRAALIQAAFGIGDEVYGQLKLLVDEPDGLIVPGHLDRTHKGCIVAAGAIEDDAVLAQAQVLGIKGFILGGITASGHENWPLLGRAHPLTVVVTEGFGARGIFPPAFEILARNQGKQAWLRPSSTGRAEIGVLLAEDPVGEAPDPPFLSLGAPVRMLRAPFSGQWGNLVALPQIPRKLESGLGALVAEVETAQGERIVVPLANLELIG